MKKEILVTNYAAHTTKARGLDVYTCECQRTVFAFPWYQAMFDWIRQSPVRALLEAKGLARTQPALLPHVIIADVEDAPLLRQSRWRVFRTPKGCKARFQIARGRKGIPAHKLLLPDAPVVRFSNGCGTDLRRANLISTTRSAVAQEMRARKAKEKEKATLQVAV